MIREASFSQCGQYRYALWRQWDRGGPTVLFVGLNPSTADHMRDDPTVRRCIGFARDWGFGRLVVVNLFALRSTSPRALRRAPDPVGPRNDRWIARLAADAELVIAAWGALGNYRDRARLVTSTLSDLYCLGRTRDGSPRHPLYVRRDAARQRFDGCA